MQPADLIADAPLLSEVGTDRADSGLEMPLRDGLGRRLSDLRVSLTERCNYRCLYCRTGQANAAGGPPAAAAELALEEIARLSRLFVSLGTEKIRLTGGEPTLREGLVELVEELGRLRSPATPDGRLDLALTTNGHRLAPIAGRLKAAGLRRVTVSMDAIDPAVFERVTRVPGSFRRVLDGVHAAQDAGLGPVKINCVLLRGVNDGEIEAFAEFSRRESVIVRFIEWMPLEEERRWTAESVIPMAEIVARLERFRPLVALPANHASETARRFTFDDGVGEIGIIAPVSQPFCGKCSRVRLTSDGKMRTCLFSHREHNLIGPMRLGATDAEMRALIRRVAMHKEDRHHIGEPGFQQPDRSMVQIGG